MSKSIIQRPGSSLPCTPSGSKAPQRKRIGRFGARRAVETDTDGWESEIDKASAKSCRSRSYINRLKRQNNKKFLKSLATKNNSSPVHIHKSAPSRGQTTNKTNDGKQVKPRPSSSKFPVRNPYSYWSKSERFKIDCCSPSAFSVSSKESQEMKINKNADWELIRKNHLVNKFDRFSRGVVKMTGRLSKETVSTITSKIRNNLEFKGGRFVVTRRACSSKRKTIGFIKKIIQGTSVKLPTFAPHRKKPQKKCSFIRQAHAPNLKTRSSILPKLVHLNSEKMLSNVSTKSRKVVSDLYFDSTKSLEDEDEIEVLEKVEDPFLTQVIGLSEQMSQQLSDTFTDDGVIVFPGNLNQTKTSIQLGKYAHGSSKRILQISKEWSIVDDDVKIEMDEDISPSPTVMSVKNEYDDSDTM